MGDSWHLQSHVLPQLPMTRPGNLHPEDVPTTAPGSSWASHRLGSASGSAELAQGSTPEPIKVGRPGSMWESARSFGRSTTHRNRKAVTLLRLNPESPGGSGQRSPGDVSTDEPRRARRHGPLDKAVAAGLDEYLQIREAAHGADLHRLGLPRFGLRRPMAPVGQYDPYDPESQRRYAMAKGDVDKRNREVASLIWEKERVLGLAPSIPPWVAIRRYWAPRRTWRLCIPDPADDPTLRYDPRRDVIIAAHYGPAAHFITAEEEWPDLLTICCGPDCGAPLTPHQVLCARCQNLTQRPSPAPIAASPPLHSA